MGWKRKSGGGAATLSPRAAAARWKKEGPPRVVLLVGPEEALRREMLETLRRAVFPDGSSPEWGRVVFFGPEAAGETEELMPAAVFDEACTLPMFAAPGERKLVEVRRAELFLDKRREMFERRLAEVPESAVVVFEARQVKRTTRLWRRFSELGCIVECGLSEGSRGGGRGAGEGTSLEAEVEARAREAGLRLTPAAFRALLERCGRTLAVLEEELAKLALVFGKAGAEGHSAALTPRDIENVCARTRLYGAFDYADKLAARNLRGALETLGGIFARGLGDHRRPGRVVTRDSEIAARLLAAATWKIFQLQDSRAAVEAGRREFDIFREAKVFGSARQSEFRRVLRGYSPAALRRAVEGLFQAQMDLRSGQAPEAVLEEMTWKICRD